MGYYSNCGNSTLDEESGYSDDFAHRLCADREQAALAADSLEIRICLIRTGIVLGPNGGALQRMLLTFRLGLGGRLGSGSQYFSWVHLQDHIRAMRFLIGNPECQGIFNLTAPEPVTNAEFAWALARVLHRPVIFPVPAAVLKIAMGEMSCLLLEGQRVHPVALRRQGFEFRFPRSGGGS